MHIHFVLSQLRLEFVVFSPPEPLKENFNALAHLLLAFLLYLSRLL